MTLRFADEVAAGMALLDQDDPGWLEPERLDLDWLWMRSACDCVLGQLYGNFWASPLLSDFQEGDQRATAVAAQYGFHAGKGARYNDWEDLRDAWVAAVEDRRRTALAGAS